jgi:hypothetical protein
MRTDLRIKRIWSKIKKKRNGCLEWKGAVGTNGTPLTGTKLLGSRSVARILYIVTFGEIPSGQLYRKCKNKLCVNPEHMSESHQGYKLTREQVLEIREKYVPWKYTLQKLADDYGVTRQAVEQALKHQTWKG